MDGRVSGNSNLVNNEIFSFVKNIDVSKGNTCDVLIDNSKKIIKNITITKPYSNYMSIIADGNTLFNMNNEQYSQLPKTMDVDSYTEFTIRGYNMQYNGTNAHKSFAECIIINYY